MEGDFIKINEWLIPLSWLYGIGVRVRNFLFDINILKSRSFDIPVISVGNITVGGAGKTPHVEYLIRLLQKKSKVAVLSRGYKRKSKGFILADESSTMNDLGDEPYQMHMKFGDVYVAVDKDRCHGIEQITSNPRSKDTDVILLDDAYQHRYVKPGINILLVDYHRLIIYDKLLPAGRLREPMSGKTRADMVIVTKCPKDLKPMSFRVLSRAMNLFPYQQLFFTCLDYSNLKPVFPKEMKGEAERSITSLKSDEHILLITGIASPEQLLRDLKPYTDNIHHLRFSDHHDFTSQDVETINQAFSALPPNRLIITTEKDASRIIGLEGLSEEVRKSIFALPIEIKIMLGQEEKFNSTIFSYVHKNSKNSILFRSHNDYNASVHKTEEKDKKPTNTIRFK